MRTDTEAVPAGTWFAARTIARDDDGGLTIDGTITMKGHTEDVEIKGRISDPISDPYGGERFGLRLEDQVREVVRNLLVEVEANAASRITP